MWYNPTESTHKNKHSLYLWTDVGHQPELVCNRTQKSHNEHYLYLKKKKQHFVLLVGLATSLFHSGRIHCHVALVQWTAWKRTACGRDSLRLDEAQSGRLVAMETVRSDRENGTLHWRDFPHQRTILQEWSRNGSRYSIIRHSREKK